MNCISKLNIWTRSKIVNAETMYNRTNNIQTPQSTELTERTQISYFVHTILKTSSNYFPESFNSLFHVTKGYFLLVSNFFLITKCYVLQPLMSCICCVHSSTTKSHILRKHVKVKQFHYTPGQAMRVPGG
jgi:hypothetical protein